jgi:L-ascorbate 6-phosphate lactonase
MRDVAYWNKSFLDEIQNNTPKQGATLQALGGPSFVYRTPQTTIWIDPYLSGTPDSMTDTYKATPIPINPNEITFGDIIISTHSHVDHCHAGTILPILQNTRAHCVAPVSSVERMKREGIPADHIQQVKAGDQFQFQDVTFNVYPGYDVNEPDAVTFVLQSGGTNLFVSGDTAMCPALTEVGNKYALDAALLAFGRTWYMNEAEMLQAARELKPKVLLPFHWEFWRGHTGNVGKLYEIYYRDQPPFEIKLLLIGDKLLMGG